MYSNLSMNEMENDGIMSYAKKKDAEQSKKLGKDVGNIMELPSWKHGSIFFWVAIITVY